MAPRKKRERPPPRYQETTRPVARICSCGAAIMRCLVDGELRSIDPNPISPRGEAMALVMGSATFAMGFGRGLPTRRRAYQIREGMPRFTRVHPEHRCGMAWTDSTYRDSRELLTDGHHQGPEAPF